MTDDPEQPEWFNKLMRSPKSKSKPPVPVQPVVRARVNHMYRDIPAKIGSVAECGRVKKTKRGFIDGAATCSDCVAAVVGPRLKAQRPNNASETGVAEP